MGAPKGHPNYNIDRLGRPPDKWTEEALNKEAEALIEWAKKEDSIVLRKFASTRGYYWEMINQWKHKNLNIASAQRYAKDVIGCRREEQALKGKLDAGIVKASMATYDSEHRAMLKEMKTAEAAKPTAYIIKKIIEPLDDGYDTGD